MIDDAEKARLIEGKKSLIYSKLKTNAESLTASKLSGSSNREFVAKTLTRATADVVGFDGFVILFTEYLEGNFPSNRVNWSKLSSNSEITIFADWSTRTQAPDSEKIWILKNYATKQSVEGREYKSLLMFYDLSCSSRRYRISMYSAHAEIFAKGAIVHETDIPFKWQVVQSDTIPDTVHAKVCK